MSGCPALVAGNGSRMSTPILGLSQVEVVAGPAAAGPGHERPGSYARVAEPPAATSFLHTGDTGNLFEIPEVVGTTNT
jgi:hypothetical protein